MNNARPQKDLFVSKSICSQTLMTVNHYKILPTELLQLLQRSEKRLALFFLFVFIYFVSGKELLFFKVVFKSKRATL